MSKLTDNHRDPAESERFPDQVPEIFKRLCDRRPVGSLREESP